VTFFLIFCIIVSDQKPLILSMKVIQFDIGSLRADHLECYGYSRPTSPTINSLSKQGLKCQSAFSSDATTAGARAAFFSGRFGLKNSIVSDGLISDVILGHTPISGSGDTAPRPLLPEYLSANGIKTAAITPFGRQPARWFYTGWSEVYDPWKTKNPEEVTSKEINALAVPWLEENSAKDFFLYLNYNDLCSKIDSPITETEMEYEINLESYASESDTHEDEFAKHRELHAAFSPRYHRASTREAIWKLVHNYDIRIRRVDKSVSEIISLLEKLKIDKKTIIIISSDHGVLLGECGCYFGHISTHFNCVRVPLIIKAPDFFESKSIMKGLCYGLDISPTICQMFGLNVPSGYDGRSIIELSNEDSLGGRDYVVCGHAQYTVQRSLISNSWKLNRTWHNGFWDFDNTELYNIECDSTENQNQAKKEPEQIRILLKKMHQWFEEYRADNPDPLACIACEEPPGFLHFGQELRARVKRGEIKAPEGYKGRWV